MARTPVVHWGFSSLQLASRTTTNTARVAEEIATSRPAAEKKKKKNRKRRDLTGAVRTRETSVAAPPASLSKKKKEKKKRRKVRVGHSPAHHAAITGDLSTSVLSPPLPPFTAFSAPRQSPLRAPIRRTESPHTQQRVSSKNTTAETTTTAAVREHSFCFFLYPHRAETRSSHFGPKNPAAAAAAVAFDGPDAVPPWLRVLVA